MVNVPSGPERKTEVGTESFAPVVAITTFTESCGNRHKGLFLLGWSWIISAGTEHVLIYFTWKR